MEQKLALSVETKGESPERGRCRPLTGLEEEKEGNVQGWHIPPLSTITRSKEEMEERRARETL